jgi:hypothetical protein
MGSLRLPLWDFTAYRHPRAPTALAVRSVQPSSPLNSAAARLIYAYFSFAAALQPMPSGARCKCWPMQEMLPCRPMMPTYMSQGNRLAQPFWTAGAMRWV